MNYTLNQIRIFLKVVKTKSITKAAEELFLTQPAVSIQLKKLQDQFDIALTEIIGKQLYVTEFGKEIAISCQKIIDEAYDIQNKTLSYKGKLFGELKISCVSTGKYVMPYFLSDFLKKNEGVEFVIDVTNKSKVIDSLEHNEVDFALVSVLPEDENYEQVELMQNKLFLIGSNESKFKSSKYDCNILETLPLIYREKGSATRNQMEKFIKSNNLQVKKKMELSSNEALKQGVLADLGYSIMPIIGIKNEIVNKELQIIPIKGLPINTVWRLIWHKNKKLSPVAKAYLEFIKKEKDSIIEKKFNWYEEY